MHALPLTETSLLWLGPRSWSEASPVCLDRRILPDLSETLGTKSSKSQGRPINTKLRNHEGRQTEALQRSLDGGFLGAAAILVHRAHKAVG